MKYLTFILSLLISVSSIAGNYPILIFTSSQYSFGMINYTFTTTVADIGPVTDQPVPVGWVTGIVSVDANGTQTFTFRSNNQSDGTKNVSDFVMEAYEKAPDSFKTGFMQQNPATVPCFSWVVSPSFSEDVPYSSTIHPAPCLAPPPTGQWCKITTPDILLEHGTLSDKIAEGNIAQGVMNIDCTSDVTVSFTDPTGDGKVFLDEGESTLTIDGKKLGEGIALKQGTNQLIIKDSIYGVHTEGFHTGSTIIIMSPY